MGRYDKRVLFSLEAERCSPGESAGVFELDGVRVGVLICGDLWYPELARELVGRVDLLCVPIKTAVPSDKHVEYARLLWRSLSLTRAMENGLVVLVSDWAAGRHDQTVTASGGTTTRKTYYTCGAATICDPGCRPDIDRLQTTIRHGQAGAVRVTVDLAKLAEYREYRMAVGLLPHEVSAIHSRTRP